MSLVCCYRSPLGDIRFVCGDHGVEALHFVDGWSGSSGAGHPVAELTRRWLDIYFSGREPDFTPPLCLTGSPFRVAVGALMLKIPYGQTVTYGELAVRIAAERGIARMAAQAVGGAVGGNPIALIVPCHRVIGAHGNLTGYGGGMERKIALLKLEGVDLADMTVPRPKRPRP